MEPHLLALADSSLSLSLPISLFTSTTRLDESREEAVNGIPDATPFAKSTFEALVFHDTCPSHSCRGKRKRSTWLLRKEGLIPQPLNSFLKVRPCNTLQHHEMISARWAE